MFHSVITPSPLYQSVFRPVLMPQLPQQPSNVYGASNTFLMDNLLRDRSAAFIARPIPTTAFPDPLKSGYGSMDRSGFGRASPRNCTVSNNQTGCSPSSVSVSSPGLTSATTCTTSQLKFSINAILSSNTSQSAKCANSICTVCTTGT